MLDPRRFWSTEAGLTGLLILLLVHFIFLHPFQDGSFVRLISRFVLSMIFVSGIVAEFRHPVARVAGLALGVPMLLAIWLAQIDPELASPIVEAGLLFMFLGFLMLVVCAQVFRGGPVTGHRIRGAIVVYLLAGGMASLLYQMLALRIPGAFTLPPGVGPSNPDALQRAFVYYSFVTLTTLGYGDITPVHPAARMVAMLEALMGQLYPAVTLASLVSLQIAHRRENR